MSSPRPEVKIVPLEQLRRSPTACLFEGGDEIDLSVFVTTYERGQSVELHIHPYPETFLIESGSASFTVGKDRIEVGEGHILTVPANTPHAFEGAGEDTLRVISCHPRGAVEQTPVQP